ncbi:hypothetical protein M2364_002600 [Acinetobacter johnsonii]|nr:hypothetical protein [Acinetobacter johnsonii]
MGKSWQPIPNEPDQSNRIQDFGTGHKVFLKADFQLENAE